LNAPVRSALNFIFFLTENIAESVTGNEDRLLFAETGRIRAALFPKLTHEKGDDGRQKVKPLLLFIFPT